MTVREYIGARYVPLLIGEWDNTVSYESLSIVTHEGDSYTSRQYVPVGIDIDNEAYWALTGNYNAQIEQYRQEVLQFDDRITQNTTDITTIDSIIPSNAFSSENTVKDYIDSGITTIDSIIPSNAFSSENTVKDYIDSGLSVLEKIATIYNSLEEAIDTVTEEDYVIKTLSYYQNGNSGGAFYKVTQEIPDGYYETCDSGVYLELIDGENVAQFGAKGDGATDDTYAIQKAIDNVDIVNFESGKTYRVSNLLISSSNKILKGNKCKIKSDNYKSDTLTETLNIGASTITVNHPEYFNVNQTAFIYNENNNPASYEVVITAINGNVLSFKSYRPFRSSSTIVDTSPFYFPSGSSVYTGTTIFSVMAGMNVSTSGIIKNVTIEGFSIEQSTEFLDLTNWAQIAYGIICYNCENVWIKDNYINGATALFMMFYGYNKNAYVENNVFENILRAQAVCAHWDMETISTANRMHNFNVVENIFNECPFAIIYSSVDGGVCQGNTIHNVTNNNRLGIYIYGGDISMYTEYASSYTQEDFYSRNIIVSNNTLINAANGGAGVSAQGTKNCKINGNTFKLVANAITSVASIDLDVSNNLVDHDYGYTSSNDSAIRIYGKNKNMTIHDNVFNCGRIMKIDSLLKTVSTGVPDTVYWGYNDSTVYVENNYITQSVGAPLLMIGGTTETNHAPTQLKDVPKTLMFNNNRVIQTSGNTLNIFNINSTLQSFITTYTNLTTQMYAYNNISYGLTLAYTEMNPYVKNSGNINMSA